MKLKSVLIIENDENTGGSVVEEFRQHQVAVRHIRGLDELGQILNTLSEYQMVILDWLLENGQSEVAKVCLSIIRQTRFIPVVVWTEEPEIFKGEADRVHELFPEAYIQVFSKDDVTYSDLLDMLENWYARPPMNLAEQFRQSLARAIEESFYLLAEHSSDDLTRGLKALIAAGDEPIIDIEHAVDVLTRLVSRAVYRDDSFASELRQIIENLQLENPPETKKERKIVSRIQDLHMYYQPRKEDQVVRMGDIIDVELSGSPQTFRAVVMTPACDLAHPRRTLHLRLSLIHKATNEDEREGKKLDKWAFLENGQTSVVCHHEILVVRNETLSSDDNLRSVMSYRHSYTTLAGNPVNLKREKRLDEPYRADLLHHFVSHAGRIGLPEFRATI